MQSDERNLRVRLPLPWCLSVIVCNTILWFKAEHPSHIIFQKNDLRPIVLEKRQNINSVGDCWQFISCCLGQSWPLFSTADQFCVGRPMVFFFAHRQTVCYVCRRSAEMRLFYQVILPNPVEDDTEYFKYLPSIARGKVDDVMLANLFRL